ncbi:11318_t:CDS:2 [Ambispora gerdemannii]|uniref:11318_t:CDS:1 n=1 Tax=Ambispora gerdemannii TaxID=144530 RepID=A0A9N8Z576_9GLOM|nr:11318_t:CDS:2 [Ambispora gerdemannii]
MDSQKGYCIHCKDLISKNSRSKIQLDYNDKLIASLEKELAETLSEAQKMREEVNEHLSKQQISNEESTKDEWSLSSDYVKQGNDKRDEWNVSSDQKIPDKVESDGKVNLEQLIHKFELLFGRVKYFTILKNRSPSASAQKSGFITFDHPSAYRKAIETGEVWVDEDKIKIRRIKFRKFKED